MATERPGDQGPDRPGLLGVAVTAAGVVLAAIVVLAVPDLREAVSSTISGDTGEVEREIDALGFGGVLIVFALAQIHAVVFYPAEILNVAAGFAYGFWPALALVMFGWIVSGWLAYAIGHFAARPLLYRLAGERRFRRGEELVHRGGITFLLLARLVPIVPYSITCYVCGAARVPLWRYTWTTFVGYLPITAVFVYFGSKLEDLSPTDPILLASVALVVVLFALTRWLAPKLTDSSRDGSSPAEGSSS